MLLLKIDFKYMTVSELSTSSRIKNTGYFDLHTISGNSFACVNIPLLSVVGA